MCVDDIMNDENTLYPLGHDGTYIENQFIESQSLPKPTNSSNFDNGNDQPIEMIHSFKAIEDICILNEDISNLFLDKREIDHVDNNENEKQQQVNIKEALNDLDKTVDCSNLTAVMSSLSSNTCSEMCDSSDSSESPLSPAPSLISSFSADSATNIDTDGSDLLDLDSVFQLKQSTYFQMQPMTKYTVPSVESRNCSISSESDDYFPGNERFSSRSSSSSYCGSLDNIRINYQEPSPMLRKRSPPTVFADFIVPAKQIKMQESIGFLPVGFERFSLQKPITKLLVATYPERSRLSNQESSSSCPISPILDSKNRSYCQLKTAANDFIKAVQTYRPKIRYNCIVENCSNNGSRGWNEKCRAQSHIISEHFNVKWMCPIPDCKHTSTREDNLLKHVKDQHKGKQIQKIKRAYYLTCTESTSTSS